MVVVTGTAMVGAVVGTGVACGAVGCVQPATMSRSIRNAMLPKMHLIFIHEVLTCEILRVACGG
jgi:hypothetical protein